MDNLVWGFSRRQDGNMSLSYGETSGSLGNRQKFLAGLGIDFRGLVCARQVHGCRIGYASEKDKGRGALDYGQAFADTDSLITDKVGLPLAVFTADCLSVFLYDAQNKTAGLVHAGWRSSRENIVIRTLERMEKEFNAQKKNLRVIFGPAIRSCCYEVSAEFNEYFPEHLVKRGKAQYLDLAGVNLKQLLDAGVNPDNIQDSKICTCCRNEDFFSFRKEGASCGRMMSVIMLK
jgi:YfiH family protein